MNMTSNMKEKVSKRMIAGMEYPIMIQQILVVVVVVVVAPLHHQHDHRHHRRVH